MPKKKSALPQVDRVVETKWELVDVDVSTPGVITITKALPTESGFIFMIIFQPIPEGDYIVKTHLVPYDDNIYMKAADDLL